jgi:ankyrin repeat protein
MLKNIGAGAVLAATIFIGGSLIWSQLISSSRPKVIYLPKEYQNAGPTPPAPNFGQGVRPQRPQRAAGPPPVKPTPAEVAAFFTAVVNGNLSNVQSMLNGNSLLAQAMSTDSGTPKHTPLHVAPTRAIAAALVDAGADVNAPDSRGDPPIRWHARDPSIAIAQYLFQIAHSPPPTDIFFVAATSDKDQSTLKKMIADDPSLIESRSRPTDILGSQETPLLVAASWDRVNVVSTLLDAGAKVDDVVGGKSGASALHLAAWNDDPALIDLLLAHGANLEAMSNSPAGTPLTWAVMRGGRKAVKDLLAHGATPTPDMLAMATKGVKGADPANLPGRATDYSAVSMFLREKLAEPATKP